MGRRTEDMVFSGYVDSALWKHANPTRHQVEAAGPKSSMRPEGT